CPLHHVRVQPPTQHPRLSLHDARPIYLYREHPDWTIQTPERKNSHGRFQYVLDFSRKEVVDRIYDMMAKILSEAKVSYIKWDMRSEEHTSELQSRFDLV